MKKQIASFLAVGGLGFAVDAGVTQFLVSFLGAGQLIARIPAILIAVSITFYFNKNHTFDARDNCMARSFGMYAISTAFAQSLNFATYSLAVKILQISDHYTFIAVAMGSVCAASVTFIMLKYWVFKK